MNFLDLEEQVIDDIDAGTAVELESPPGIASPSSSTSLCISLVSAMASSGATARCSLPRSSPRT